MTAATTEGAGEETTEATALQAEARALAGAQRHLRRTESFIVDLLEPSRSHLARALERARKFFAASRSEDPVLQRAAEWLLDNYYLVRRVTRQVTTELPTGFVRRLPLLADGPAEGIPRIDALARGILVQSRLELDVDALRAFLLAYQEVSVLTIAELWALPTMLRISVLHGLLHFLEELGVPIHGRLERAPLPRAPPDTHPFALGPGVGVERSIRTLRVLAEIDWKAFFENTNRVEAILRGDPIRVYSRMDFETCDSYRKVVEELAWSTGVAEEDVAERAVELARQEIPDPRAAHVGHYLVSNGRRALEERLGYRPRGIERVRAAVTNRPALSYFAALAASTGSSLLLLGWALARARAAPSFVAISLALAVLPASILAVVIVQWAIAHLIPPRTLPKLDFARGLPSDLRSLVVIPTLLGRREDVDGMLRQIELHFLSNRDPGLQFALLTDEVDSVTMPVDTSLVDLAARGIEALNAAHSPRGRGPFHLLHREPRWNAAEARFMGWERKRGKLDELNRLLRGAKDTSFKRHVGDPDGLRGIRFVITVDSDTQLPMGTARRLVGVLAHPLNEALFDERTGRVVSGYTIIQPRVETSPSSSRQTLFARIFAGDVGFDIYTHAVSDTYQDLFGAGIYVGKGIYDVDAFMRSVEGRVPENALASHDLFEGIHGRTALATDIVLFEDYPGQYAAYARRMHRWVRGDWQLVPWLFPAVPSADGRPIANRLEPIDRWKILDNLRRSLASPVLFGLVVLGLTCLPGAPIFWTLGALGFLLLPSFPALLHDRRRRALNAARCLLTVAFLAHEAAVVTDAIVRVAVRMAISRRNLLQWTSTAHTAFGLRARSPRSFQWREMAWSPVLAVGTAALTALTRPHALWTAAPLLALWFFAPEIARWVSRPSVSRERALRPEERRRLRLLARRTWRFFDAFVGPNDQWLPIDNYQEEPREQTAHRTSPTNIGMMLLSTLAAYDLGYLGPSELALRVRRTFESIERLAHYQGHLFNWYETKDLRPLLPCYVSTVDSGNFAGALIVLKEGCRRMASAPVLRAAAWDGLADSFDLLEAIVLSVSEATALRSAMSRMRSGIEAGRTQTDLTHGAFRSLCEDDAGELDRQLLALFASGAVRHDADTLRELRASMDRFHHQLRQMRQEIDLLLPWLALAEEPAARGLTMGPGIGLDRIPEAARALLAQVDQEEHERLERGELTPELEASSGRLRAALRTSEARARALVDDLLDLARRAEDEVSGMDFRLLYDRERRLFHIGYNATQDQLDCNYYDLLASEARLASYLAIAKGDAPESHWSALGRPMVQVSGAPVLVSWGGTMFEYLMPSLLMRSREGTLLARTCELVVEAHIAYGEKMHAPWGISESAYARVDAHQTHQYQSFGVPGLGFKRGLDDDLVVAPYASMLAASLRPRAVLDNIERFEQMGMLGTYGLFESVDMRPERAAPDGRPFAVVRSYMAHHQGMLLVAIDNLLNDQIMVERFHADPLIETGELLLNERAPWTAPAEWPAREHVEGVGAVIAEPVSNAPAPWSPGAQGRPQAFVLGNGRLASIVTDSGGGGLQWKGIALTRYQQDVVGDDDGFWIYLRDEASGRVWRATSEHGRTTFAMHKAEFHQRDDGISVHVDVAIAPADDVEVRQITLHNETDRARAVAVISAAEPVLLASGPAAAHPAFARMFVESDHLADLDALVFTRRPRSANEDRAALVHRLVMETSEATFGGYETDRAAFFGRGGSTRAPRSLAVPGRPLRGRTGAVIDPIMSLMARVELKPKRTVTLAFVTTVARTRNEALELARRYGSMHAVRWVFRDAERESGRRLARAQLGPDLVPTVQRLFSALLFADPASRAPPEVLAAGRPTKRHLWGRGISGDHPILLVRVSDPEAPLLREALAAQRFLRTCGVRFDLVLIDEQASGYMSDAAGTLQGVLRGDADEWMGRPGGVFVIPVDRLQGDECTDLEAAARVVLDTRDGTLGSRMSRPVESPPKGPRFEPTRPEPADQEAPAGPPRPDRMSFENGIGGFTEDGREYVLSVGPGAQTPAPWCNVLANPSFGCLVSESSLGCTWSLNAGENRLTPWRNDPVLDMPSEALYLRDEESAAVWSPTPLPAGGDAETLVRHGAGYTTYSTESHGLLQELTVFVPSDAPLKVARLRLTNTLARRRRLTATYYAEWVLGSQREEQRAYVTSEHDPAQACLLATCTWNAEYRDRVAFLASALKAHGFTTDRASFLGRRGGYARPEGLAQWGLAGSVAPGVDPCAALQVHLELGPGDRLETHFILGQAADREEALGHIARFRDPATVETAWKDLHAFWDAVLGAVRVKTPEPAMDVMLNRWLLYQTLSSRVFGRTGFYQSSGAFGFRDQLQDVLALLHAAPERARAHILECARHQFGEGDVLHWWHPPTGRGVRTRCSDDMAWLPFATAEYVNATGDTSILSEEVPFLTGGEPLRRDEHDRYAEFAPASGASPLFEHCERALERAATEGRHGLPLMGDGDWNDGMNRVGAEGRGESVWLGWFLCATMNGFAGLCERCDQLGRASIWRSRATALRAKIEEAAWDGGWYVRAFHDDGSLVGSSKERECQIDSIAQSWAVLSALGLQAVGSGLPAESRARVAVCSADDRLVREDEGLAILLTPPFDTTTHDPGYIRAYPPGVRENGGQYTHAATWLGMAHAALGDGERAARVFRILNPILHARTREQSKHYRVEPYVVAGDVYGAPPWVGRGGWTWYTGSAAWLFRLGVEGILGLRRDDGGLRIDPCIPPTWGGFEAWIRVGMQQIHVVVENPDAVGNGDAQITLDGALVESTRLQIDPGVAGQREVTIRLGRPPHTARRESNQRRDQAQPSREKGEGMGCDRNGDP